MKFNLFCLKIPVKNCIVFLNRFKECNLSFISYHITNNIDNAKNFKLQ